jgi:antitoxin HicB
MLADLGLSRRDLR